MKTKAKAKIADPVKQLSRLMWPHFSPGLLLQDEDLTLGVEYTRELSRLMFRTLFGCGVMCGLVIEPKEKCCKLHIFVDKGVALDCRGDPVYVPERQDITIDPCDTDLPDKLWVVLRRFDKCCAPRTPVCSPDDDEMAAVCTKVRDGYEIRVLAERPECSCGCHEDKEKPEGTAHGHGQPTGQVEQASTTSGAAAKQDQGTYTKAGEKPANPCKCADPAQDCYEKHYAGECCDCCDCEWIVLAVVSDKGTAEKHDWHADHSVRRFVRPVLMRDPQVEKEATSKAE
jgi:hypothetical protein